MKIGELAQRTGLSAHTIRYYERIGLLPYAARDPAHRRDYDTAILTWIEFLGRLKTTGMPIRDMLRYAELRRQGAASANARRELLAAHRLRVAEHLAELQACLLVLDEKIVGYADTTTGKHHEHHAPATRPTHPGKPARPRSARAR
jgi:DNA-binding transcriptional MerR regulator